MTCILLKIFSTIRLWKSYIFSLWFSKGWKKPLHIYACLLFFWSVYKIRIWTWKVQILTNRFFGYCLLLKSYISIHSEAYMYSNCTSQYFEKANCVPELQSKHSATHFYYVVHSNLDITNLDIVNFLI